MFAIVTTANTARMPMTMKTITLCARATSVEPMMLTPVMMITMRPANTLAQTVLPPANMELA